MIVAIVVGERPPEAVDRWFDSIGVPATVSLDRDAVRSADGVVLAADGRVRAVLQALREAGLDRTLQTVAARGGAILGLDVGAHALAEMTTDGGAVPGLGLLAATALPLTEPAPHPVPRVGWTVTRRIDGTRSPLPEEPGWALYQHTHHLVAADRHVLGAAIDGDRHVAAAVGSGRVLGLQFRAERSGEYGAETIRRWAASITAVAA